jgi:predicted RNA polymerase sigma factor
MESRVALTLRLLGGLTTEEIARAYLVPEPTIAQRIVRAKRTLAEARVPFETPRGPELEERIAAVLRVLYLVFNEGYSPSSGESWTRPELVDEAMRIGRVLAELAPREPEVHGLIALMELQASRLRARVASDGTPILLLDQDRSRWDALLIRRGLAALDRAQAVAAELGGALGPYALQAAIAACHARARTGAETAWTRIAAIYDALVELVPTPVVALIRAVAVSMAFGPAEALPLLDELRDDPLLARYYPLPAARADVLAKLGRRAEARAEFERAADLAGNARDAAVLRARAREMVGS